MAHSDAIDLDILVPQHVRVFFVQLRVPDEIVDTVWDLVSGAARGPRRHTDIEHVMPVSIPPGLSLNLNLPIVGTIAGFENVAGLLCLRVPRPIAESFGKRHSRIIVGRYDQPGCVEFRLHLTPGSAIDLPFWQGAEIRVVMPIARELHGGVPRT